jgi:aspartyl aminopeptidase
VNDTLKFNQETEFVPILSQIAAQFNPPTTDSDSDDSSSETPTQASSDTTNNHHPGLLSVIAEELSIAPEDIHDLELCGSFFSCPSALAYVNVFCPAAPSTIHNLQHLAVSTTSSSSALD